MTMTPSGALIIQRIDRSIIVGVATREQRIAGLVAMGHSEQLAWAIEDGALGSRVAAVGLGRARGLLAKVETDEARQAGLIGR